MLSSRGVFNYQYFYYTYIFNSDTDLQENKTSDNYCQKESVEFIFKKEKLNYKL